MWLVALRPDCKTGGRQRSQRDSYLEHICLNILSYLSKCLIIFVSISYHICLNVLSYLSSMYYHICLKILSYLSQCLITFFSISLIFVSMSQEKFKIKNMITCPALHWVKLESWIWKWGLSDFGVVKVYNPCKNDEKIWRLKAKNVESGDDDGHHNDDDDYYDVWRRTWWEELVG